MYIRVIYYIIKTELLAAVETKTNHITVTQNINYNNKTVNDDDSNAKRDHRI